MQANGAIPSGVSTRAPHPLVSVCICSRNRPQLLLDTVMSVLEGGQLPAELLVIDQSDNPCTQLTALDNDPTNPVRYRWTQETGVSRGRNMAFESAAHDYIALLDDDMYVAPDWMQVLSKALVDYGPDAVVVGSVPPAEEERSGGFVPSVVTSPDPAHHTTIHQYDQLTGGHMAAHKDLLNVVGEWDERLGPGTDHPAAEDLDFGLRLLSAGFTIRYVPEAVVYHRAWRSGQRQVLRMQWAYGRGIGGFYAKHAGRRDTFTLKLLARDVKYNLGKANPIRYGRFYALTKATLVAGILIGFLHWLARVTVPDAIRRWAKRATQAARQRGVSSSNR